MTLAPAAPRRTDPQQYAPTAPPSRYTAPRGHVDRDASLSWLRRMRPILRSHALIVFTGISCAALTLTLAIAVPRITMDAIDKALIDRAEPLTPYVVAIGILAIGRFALGYVYRLNLQRSALAIEYDLRNEVFAQFGRLPFAYFDRVQTGQLISRANSDIRSVQMFLAFAPTVAITLVSFVAALGLMLTIHVGLAIVAVLTVPLVYLTGIRMRSIMFPASWIVSSRMADVATIVEENVTGTRVVKSFAAEEHQLRLLGRAAERLRWANGLIVGMRAKYAPLMQNLPRAGFVLVLIYGGWLAIDKQVTIGALVAFNSYVVMLQAPFMMLGFMMMMGQRAKASAGRIFEIIDAPTEVESRPGAIDLIDPAGEVTFESVRFGYGDGPEVLRGLDLHLRAGETVALVGRTGTGKSTVARLIPRFYDVSGGAVRIDGHDVRDLTLASLRHHIGLVLDEPFLFSESVRDNIAYGRPDASDDEVVAAARAAGADVFISALSDGYATVIGERGYTLSGGQRQRIAVARTLLTNPRVLILDDATSSIDVQVESEIHDALRTLMEGRTTLVIAHRLSTISLASRVVLLVEGEIVASGTHAELLRTVPAYADVLAHAEEEYAAAHAPEVVPEPEIVSPRERALQRLAQARSAPDGAPPAPGIPGGFSAGGR